MNCKHCGTTLDSQAKFCPKCGYSLSENQNDSHTDQSHSTLKSPWWFKALLCFVVIVICGSVFMALLSEDITDTVEDQLKAIRKGEISEAYHNFTSKRFQDSTSFDIFEQFVHKYPAFSENKSIQFNDRNVNDHIGILETILITTNNEHIPVEFKLVKEADKWKILSLRIEDHNPNPSSQPTSISTSQQIPFQEDSTNPIRFTKFVLGNSVDNKGFVKNPMTAFEKNVGDINFNLYVSNVNQDTSIEIALQHVDSQSSLKPVTTRVSPPGDSILSFVFSPPKIGWPVGTYRIQAQTQSGVKESFDFKVE